MIFLGSRHEPHAFHNGSTLATGARTMKSPSLTRCLHHPDGLVLLVSLVSLALTIGSTLLG